MPNAYLGDDKIPDDLLDSKSSDYPPREKAVIDTGAIETPEMPRIEPPEAPVVDGYIRPENIPVDLWDSWTDQQKKACIATMKANKIHAERHGG